MEVDPQTTPRDADVAVVVLTCDGYSDLWGPFFRQFFLHWPKCPYPIYLASNERTFGDSRIRPALSGPDSHWSASVRRSLAHISEANVLFLIDDGFFIQNVDHQSIERIADLFTARGMNYLRLKGDPLPDRRVDETIGEVLAGSYYRTALVPSLWRKEVLLDLLVDAENVWEFEINGSERSDKYPGFYSVYVDQFKFVHGVVKGKWLRSAVEELEAAGCEIKRGTRPIMESQELSDFRIGQFRSLALRCVPRRWRRSVRRYSLVIGGQLTSLFRNSA